MSSELPQTYWVEVRRKGAWHKVTPAIQEWDRAELGRKIAKEKWPLLKARVESGYREVGS